MTGAGSLSPSPQPVTEDPPALSLSGRCGVSPQKWSAETVARPQGKAFPVQSIPRGGRSYEGRG